MNGRLNLGGVMGSRTLKLTLKKKWFDLMITGDKNIEFRKPSKWIESRLFVNLRYRFLKDIKFVKFTNGYGADKPYFICEFKGVIEANKVERFHYSTEIVEVEKGDYLIHLGKVLEKGNI